VDGDAGVDGAGVAGADGGGLPAGAGAGSGAGSAAGVVVVVLSAGGSWARAAVPAAAGAPTIPTPSARIVASRRGLRLGGVGDSIRGPRSATWPGTDPQPLADRIGLGGRDSPDGLRRAGPPDRGS
jgi:hypothetical protein